MEQTIELTYKFGPCGLYRRWHGDCNVGACRIGMLFGSVFHHADRRIIT